MLVAWRVSKRRHPPYDGEGARLHGGRWTSRGRVVIYASDTFAGAILEIAAACRQHRRGWSGPGARYTAKNSSATGNCYSRASLRSRSSRFHEATMTHDIYRVENFEIVGPYTLMVRFDDGSHQRIDLLPVLEGELFGPLKNMELFNAVVLDREVGTLVWPNGADFDPTTLHDWPIVREEMVAMARRWAERSNARTPSAS